MPTIRYRIRGRVQGVGYRYFAWRAAADLGVTGFCRNLADGSVEVVAEGGDGALRDLEQRLREGPSFANVDSVEREAIAARGDESFEIR